MTSESDARRMFWFRRPLTEARERGAPKNLACTPGPIVELAPIADRVGMGLDGDLQVLASVLRFQVDIDNDAEERLRLVGNLLKQAQNVADPDDLAAVVPADLEDAALGVGESADPLQVFVPPGRLPLDVLGLRRHRRGRLPCRRRGWAAGWYR